MSCQSGQHGGCSAVYRSSCKMEKLKQRMWLTAMIVILAVFSTVMLVGAAQGAAHYDIQTEDEETAASTIDIVEFVTTAATVRVEAAETTTEETTESDYQSMIGSLDFGVEDAEILLKVAMAEAEGGNRGGKSPCHAGGTEQSVER